MRPTMPGRRLPVSIGTVVSGYPCEETALCTDQGWLQAILRKNEGGPCELPD